MTLHPHGLPQSLTRLLPLSKPLSRTGISTSISALSLARSTLMTILLICIPYVVVPLRSPPGGLPSSRSCSTSRD